MELHRRAYGPRHLDTAAVPLAYRGANVGFDFRAGSPALSLRPLFFRARARAVNPRPKKFETVLFGMPHRIGLELANHFPLNDLRKSALAPKFANGFCTGSFYFWLSPRISKTLGVFAVPFLRLPTISRAFRR